MNNRTELCNDGANRGARMLGSMLALALLAPAYLRAEQLAAVNLRSLSDFVVLAGSKISDIPTSNITGDIGLSPAAGSLITGFGDGEVTGTIFTVDETGPAGSQAAAIALTAAKGDLTTAYNDAAGRTPVPTGPFLDPGAGDIGGMTLVPGLYKFTSGLAITGSDLTLAGTATDVWIFQIASDLNVGNGVHVTLAGGALAANVFWQVGTSATLGTTSVFQGTIMADQSISLNTGATLIGRALASSAAVTLASNTITKPANATSNVNRLEDRRNTLHQLRPIRFTRMAGILFPAYASGAETFILVNARGQSVSSTSNLLAH